MKTDDVVLIQLTLAGDEAAFARLVRKYQKQVHAYALRKIGDFHIAEDITQETFVEAYQNLENLRDPMKFSAWLFGIANHLCIAWFRKNRSRSELLRENYTINTETDTYSPNLRAGSPSIYTWEECPPPIFFLTFCSKCGISRVSGWQAY